MYKKDNSINTRLFLCNIPLIATYSEAELELYGLPITIQNGKMNKDTYNDTTRVMISVNRMVDLYSAGMPISVLKIDDTAEIYKILDNYLSKQDEQQHSLNGIVDKDEDRLAEIDKFATEMFGYNKNTIVKGNMNASSGFGLKVNLLNHTAPAGSIHKATDMDYILDNTPKIDMAKIERKSMTKRRRRVTTVR